MSVGARARVGRGGGDESRLILVGPWNVFMVLVLPKAGLEKSKPGSSLRGELPADATRVARIAPLRSGGRSGASATA